MTAQLIDGKAIAQKIQREVAQGAAAFQVARGRAPELHLVLASDDSASAGYVRSKERALNNVGIRAIVEHVSASISQAELIARIEQLNADSHVDGVLIQMPLPPHLDEGAVLEALDPAKDVDGLTLHNAGRLALGRPRFVPCTALGCLRLLEDVGTQLSGAHAVVIGRSALVGRPVAHLLLARHATVTVAHSRSRELQALVARADVLVSAAGRAALVRGTWIKPGAVVIDVANNRDAAGKLCGDVEFEAARERASFITPVPGGVGPMTVAMLLANTLAAAVSSGPASRGA